MRPLTDGRDRLVAVRFWLWTVALTIVVTILVGGLTRLTGSGLSITEWRPITGVLPPMSEADWLAEFDRYRAIPQFLVVNAGMTLSEFKVIYWWEWVHRLLGRLVGVIFAVPFAIFLWRGILDRALVWKLAGLFALGGLQGAIGWWMVQSGLAERTDVSQYRLAIHLTLACVILAGVVGLAVRLIPAAEKRAAPRALAAAWVVLVLVLLQIFLGALVAKTGAGRTFNTWPLIDGRLIPPADALLAMEPFWRNFFENVLTVQFDHRVVAYALVLVTALHAFDLQASGPFPAAFRAALVLATTVAQAMLGVLTLVHLAPLALAFAHQALAIALLILVTVHTTRLRHAASA